VLLANGTMNDEGPNFVLRFGREVKAAAASSPPRHDAQSVETFP